jgi:16S rRNA processing protein RimM
MSEEYISIGHTEKPHGLNGELKLKVQEVYWDDLEYLETLYLKIKGKPVPYFVDEIRIGNKMIIKFEDVDDRDAAQVISSTEVLAKITDLEREEGEDAARSALQYGACLGFTVIDAHDGAIGVIQEVVAYPSQEMATVQHGGKEYMLPLHPHFVVRIDKEAKELHTNLPEGIFDLG